MPGRVQAAIALSVVAGALIYIAGAFWADTSEVIERASAIRPSIWALMIATTLFYFFVRFVRWAWYIEALGGRVPAWRHFLFYLSGFSLTTTPGKAGEAIRSIFLVRYGVRVSDCVSALFVERLIDVLSIAIMAGLAASIMVNPVLVISVAVVIVGFSGAIVISPFATMLARRIAESRSEGRVARIARQIGVVLESSRRLLGWRLFLGGNVLGLVAWFGPGFGLYLLLNELGAEIPILVTFGIYGASALIGMLSFLPGGLGSTEAAMTAMLIVVGLDAATAVLATIVCRLVTLWLAVLIGIITMLVATKIEQSQKD